MTDPSRRPLFTAALLAAVLAVAACAPTLVADFTNWDDPDYVTRNTAVRDFDLGALAGQFHVATYGPLTMLSYAIDHALFGPSPRAFHATNLVLHAAATAASCWLAFLLLGSVPGAFLVAALFAVHPLHVEPVAWVSGRKELLAALFALVALGARRSRLVGLAACLFVVPLLPVLQFIPLGTAVAADRYAYLPAFGPLLLVGAVFARWSGRMPARALAGGVIVVFGALAFARCGVWRDSVSLWTDVLSREPAAELAWLNRADARAAAGDRAGSTADLQALTALAPRSADGWNNRGTAWYRLGEDARARADFERALQIDPGHPTALLNRGLARARTGDLPGAADDLARAAALAPRDATPLVKRGLVMLGLRRPAEAIADFTAALARDGAQVEALVNRAVTLAGRGDSTRALADLDRAVALVPGDAQVVYTRGVVRGRAGDVAGARADFERALSIDPGHAGARAALRGGS